MRDKIMSKIAEKYIYIHETFTQHTVYTFSDSADLYLFENRHQFPGKNILFDHWNCNNVVRWFVTSAHAKIVDIYLCPAHLPSDRKPIYKNIINKAYASHFVFEQYEILQKREKNSRK